MVRITIALYFCTSFVFFSFAQVLTIKDRETRQPLEAVNVYSEIPRASAVTDAKGRADLSGFTGADSIRIEIIGYESLVCSFDQLKARHFKVFLSEIVIPMNQVVVTATRWQQEKRDVPYKTICFRSAQIQMQNPQTAADLLANSGKVFVQKSQLGGGSPMIRGFAANRILITVDGVRMNTAIFRSGNLHNVISLDPLATEKTEVVFGPGSMMYGSDAIGGVIGFYTLEPEFSSANRVIFKGNATARTSSSDFEKTGHFDVNIGLHKWAFLTSITCSDYENLKMGTNGPDDYLRPHYAMRINGRDSVVTNHAPKEQVPTGYSQMNLMQKIRFRPNDHWDLNYAFHYSKSSDIPRYDRLIEVRNGHLRDAEWYYGPQEWLMSALDLQHVGRSNLYNNAKFILAYQFFEESRHDRGFGETGLYHRIETVDMFSANFDFEKIISVNKKLFYGGEIVLNTVGSKSNSENIETGARQPISTRYPDGSTWNSYAVYLNHLVDLGKNIALQSGIRYNHITLNSEFDTTFFPLPFTSANLNTGALTGSVGMTFHPNKNWEFYLNGSTGFRAPNVDDIGKVFDSEPGSVVVPNPKLKSEYAYNAEVGITKVFGDVVKVDVTGFRTLLDDALVRRNFTLNGQDSIVYDGALSQVQAIQNAAKANVWGVQAGIEIKLPAGFGLISHVNYQHGEEELENGSTAPLRHVSPWFGDVHLTYRRQRLKADLHGIYNGDISFEDLPPSEQNKPHLYAADQNGNPYSPDWYTINFKVTFRLTDFLMLAAGLENMTDLRYRTFSSGIAAPGRNLVFAVNATF